MKIGITFFGSKLDLLCISKVLIIFWVFSKIRLKRNAPGDTWRARRVPRRSLGAGLSGRGTRRAPEGALGARPLGELPGGALGLGSIRGGLPARYPGTGVALAGFS